MANEPTANVTPEEGNACLGEIHAVGALLDPTRDKHLILETECVKEDPLNVRSHPSKRQGIWEDKLALYRRNREIVRVGQNYSMMLTVQSANAAEDGSTSARPEHRGSLYRPT